MAHLVVCLWFAVAAFAGCGGNVAVTEPGNTGGGKPSPDAQTTSQPSAPGIAYDEQGNFGQNVLAPDVCPAANGWYSMFAALPA
jgi:hypothetical protein